MMIAEIVELQRELCKVRVVAHMHNKPIGRREAVAVGCIDKSANKNDQIILQSVTDRSTEVVFRFKAFITKGRKEGNLIYIRHCIHNS